MNLSVYKSQIIIGLLTLLSFVIVAQKPISINEKITIEGQVLEAGTEVFVPFATIIVNGSDGSKLEVLCDSIGKYNLQLDKDKFYQIKAKSDKKAINCSNIETLKYFSSVSQIIDSSKKDNSIINLYLRQHPSQVETYLPKLSIKEGKLSVLTFEDTLQLLKTFSLLIENTAFKIKIELRTRNENLSIDSLKLRAIKARDFLVKKGLDDNMFILSNTLSYHKVCSSNIPYNQRENSLLKEGVILTNEMLNKLSEEELKLVEQYLDGIFFTVYSK